MWIFGIVFRLSRLQTIKNFCEFIADNSRCNRVSCRPIKFSSTLKTLCRIKSYEYSLQVISINKKPRTNVRNAWMWEMHVKYPSANLQREKHSFEQSSVTSNNLILFLCRWSRGKSSLRMLNNGFTTTNIYVGFRAWNAWNHILFLTDIEETSILDLLLIRQDKIKII